MEVRYFKTERREVRKTIPDEYGHDTTPRGQVVDILIGPPHRKTGRTRRDELYDEDEAVFESALRAIEEAYEKAAKIVALFEPMKNGS